MSRDALARLVTAEALRRAAGARSFERGRDYQRQGLVGALKLEDQAIAASVSGAERYRVLLDVSGGALAGSCTCPVGRDGGFCKHCVALGLAWLTGGSGDEEPPPSGDELRKQLVTLGAEALAALLVERARDDDTLHARLLAMTAPDDARAGGRLAQAFEIALDPGGFIDWREMYDYASGLDAVIDNAQRQLAGQPVAMITFCERALEGIERAYEFVDDSNGMLGDTAQRLQDLHLDACERARPDPRPLAERLFGYQVADDYGHFDAAAETYAHVLGAAGLARYRELTQAAWEALPSLGPGDDRRRHDGNRWTLERMMLALARAEDDADAVVEILRRDLSGPHRYLQIAETLQAAGRPDEATVWAERGLAAGEERRDARLVDFLVSSYGQAERHDDAMRLAWDAFAAAPQLTTYQRLSRAARRAGEWPAWRERAQAQLRKRKGERSELVAILLDEDDADTAWAEAQEHGCRPDLWLDLARRREQEHPRDALGVYLTRIEPAIRHSDGHTYDGAVAWLETVERLYRRLDEEATFAALIAGIRATHRAKRNLMRRLDQKRW